MPIRVDLRRLESEVIELEKKPIQQGKILFYGDSIFTRWKSKWGFKSLEAVIIDKNGNNIALNHGIGSSTAEETLYYYPRLVKPYKPIALVYKVFGNDWLFGYSAIEIFELTRRVIEYALCDFPGIKLYISDVGICSREENILDNWNYVRDEYNSLLYNYAVKHNACKVISTVSSPLFFNDSGDIGKYEKVRKDIFIEDGVHFNKKGYELYGQFIKSELNDLLN